jgi:hypothetical protein
MSVGHRTSDGQCANERQHSAVRYAERRGIGRDTATRRRGLRSGAIHTDRQTIGYGATRGGAGKDRTSVA